MKRLSTLLLALVLVLVMVLPASATAYYPYMDYYYQQSVTTYPDHIVPRKWQSYQWYGKPQTEVLWWQDPTYLGTDTTLLENAINAWVGLIARPELGFKKGASNNKDLTFKLDNPKVCSTHWGCIIVTSWSLNNTTKVHTWHWLEWRMGLNILSLTGNAYAAAHMNMVGQILGMYHFYDGAWDVCNPDRTSVMDGIIQGAFGNPDTYCDSPAPNGYDLLNAQKFWGYAQEGQEYQNNGSGTSGSSTVWAAWTDEYWSEFEHRTQWYYSTNNGASWVWFAYVANYTDIGTHSEIALRSIQVNMVPGNYGVSKSAATHILACAEAYYTPTRRHGWHCSAPIAW